MDPLGFDKAPQNTRIVVGMSGGVDSAVTAGLLVETGYDVVGITLQLYDQGAAVGKKGACCAGQDIRDAARAAEKLGIPHYVLDYEERFRRAVIDDFADSYAGGETPIPCIRCNQTVKFSDLLSTAQDLGADALATGHYARRLIGAQGPELHRSADNARDQSYFLFATTPEQLAFLRFPLGDIHKDETRRIAARLGLDLAEKPDSQDICFVPSGRYADLVAKLRPEAVQPGEIIDLDGKILGRHQGIINYTVGQRRGLDLGGFAEPLYVIRLEPETARVIVGPRSALARQLVRLGQVNWLNGDPAQAMGSEVTIKLRSAQAPASATLNRLSSGRNGLEAELLLQEPIHGVAPGQAGVIYQGNRVLGGGWIRHDTQKAVAA